MHTLRYNKPAKCWEEALPLGNGRIGAMVYGGVDQERLQLNEDTLWSGRRTARSRNVLSWITHTAPQIGAEWTGPSENGGE